MDAVALVYILTFLAPFHLLLFLGILRQKREMRTIVRTYWRLIHSRKR